MSEVGWCEEQEVVLLEKTIIFWSRGCFPSIVDKNPAKTISTKSTRIKYGRIFSQVPQAAWTITIFLLLYTVCHVAQVDSRVHVP